MQINIYDIAKKLIEELEQQELSMRLRAEGVALLFHRIQEAHAQLSAPAQPETGKEEASVEG